VLLGRGRSDESNKKKNKMSSGMRLVSQLKETVEMENVENRTSQTDCQRCKCISAFLRPLKLRVYLRFLVVFTSFPPRDR